MKTAYRISKHAHLFERGEILAIYHALSFEVFYGTQALKRLLSKFGFGATPEIGVAHLSNEEKKESMETINTLITDEFLIPVQKNEMDEIQELSRKLVGFPEISILYLLLTGQCNLRCKYCFVETPKIPETYKTGMMTPKMAKLGIDTYAKALANNPENKLQTRNVYYYGGEPLLN